MNSFSSDHFNPGFKHITGMVPTYPKILNQMRQVRILDACDVTLNSPRPTSYFEKKNQKYLDKKKFEIDNTSTRLPQLLLSLLLPLGGSTSRVCAVTS